MTEKNKITWIARVINIYILIYSMQLCASAQTRFDVFMQVPITLTLHELRPLIFNSSFGNKDFRPNCIRPITLQIVFPKEKHAHARIMNLVLSIYNGKKNYYRPIIALILKYNYN